MRNAISLLEVLISMFVLTIGLLYLGTLVPVGQFQISQATHADVSTVVGNSAFREIRVRDMMDGAHWVYLSSAGPAVFRPVLGEPLIADADRDGYRDTSDRHVDIIT